MKLKLEGQRVAVIGASGGIGNAIALELEAQGAHVLVTSRGTRPDNTNGPYVALDLADVEAPELLANTAREELGGLDALVNATGGLGEIGPTRSIDPNKLTERFALGPVAALGLIQACANLLDDSPNPSVVLFSGGGATDAFPRYSAYSLEKVAMVRLMENLAVEEPQWKVNAIAPGFVATGIHEPTLRAGLDSAGDYFHETQRRLDSASVSPSLAAELCAFLVSPTSFGISGRLISAAWDPWSELAGQNELRESTSFGRLRRIDNQWFQESNS
jgi:NAD(P)-dependent dehydrogenase (short-subunit alcohol dehydrogenase family)